MIRIGETRAGRDEATHLSRSFSNRAKVILGLEANMNEELRTKRAERGRYKGGHETLLSADRTAPPK
jgi:hypothetical protein